MSEDLRPRIVVFGIGGAGGNAVDNMIEANLQGVEFIVANTDAQALNRSKTENRIQLGPDVTGGLGAGARPDVGAEAAEESMDVIQKFLDGANMVF
ncbi:MAG: cell division protein FtsZ, partial [Pseudomonadota bacterium]